MSMMTRGRLSTVLLAGGALVGVALAGASLVTADEAAEVPEDAVAVVNGQPVLRTDYERALTAVAADRRDGRLTESDRERVLERLVDQELLVGRALELGLASRDRKVRNDLAAAMIDVLRARAEAAPDPSDEELRRFYRDEAQRFATEPRFTIEHGYFRVDDRGDAAARQRAAELIRTGTLAGAGDAFDLPVPTEPVPASVLVQRLGPTAARGVMELEVGEVGGPWRSSHGYHVARLIARSGGQPPPFEQIRDRVLAEHRRVAGERELEAFLERRRDESDIERVELR